MRLRWAEDLLVAAARSAARYPKRTLGVALSLAVCASIIASGLRFAADYAALLPSNAPETRDYRWAMDQGADAWFTLIAIETSDAATGARLDEGSVDTLVQQVVAMEEVEYALARFPRQFFMERGLYFASDTQVEAIEERVRDWADRQRRLANPLYVDLEFADSDSDGSELLATLEEEVAGGLSALAAVESSFVSADGRYRFVWVRPRFSPMDVARSAAFLGDLRATIDTVSGIYNERIAGPYASIVAEDTEIATDIESTTLWAALLVLFVILLQTRSLRAVVVIVVPLAVAITLTLAWARVWVGQLNVVSGFLTPVLFGLGVDYAIHFHDAFARARGDGSGAAAAVEHAARETGAGSIGAAVTTSAAFCALAFCRFRGFSEFGAIGAMGVMAALAATYTVVPAVLCLFSSHAAKASGGHDAPLPRSVAFVVLAAAALAATYAILRAPSLEFEGDLDRLRAPSDSLAFDAYVEEAVGGATAPALVYVLHEDDVAAVRQTIESVGADIGLRGVHALSDFLPPSQAERRVRLAGLDAELSQAEPESEAVGNLLARVRTWTTAQPFTEDDLPASLRARFRSEGAVMLVLDAHYDESSIEDARSWSLAMNRVRQAHPGRVHVLSGAAVSGRLFQVVFDDVPWAVAGTLGAILFVLGLLLGRGLLWPFVLTVASLVTLVGLMALFSLRLNVFNALMLPTLLGVGVDNALHMHRSPARKRGGWVLLATTGRSALAASATTAAAFGVLAVADHRGVASIGVVAMLGIGIAAFYTVVVYAAILRLTGRPAEP